MEFLIATSIFFGGGASIIDEYDFVHEINKFPLIRDNVFYQEIKNKLMFPIWLIDF